MPPSSLQTTTSTTTTTTSTDTTTSPGPVISCTGQPTGAACVAGEDERCAIQGVCFAEQCTNSGPLTDGTPCAGPGPNGLCFSGVCSEGTTLTPGVSSGSTANVSRTTVAVHPSDATQTSSEPPTTKFNLLPTGAAGDTPGAGVVYVAADILLVDARPSVYLVSLAEFSIFTQEILKQLKAALPQASIAGLRHVGAYPALPQRLQFRIEVIGSATAGELVASSLGEILRSTSFLAALKADFPVQSQSLAQVVVDAPISVVEPAVAPAPTPPPAAASNDDGTPLLAIILGTVAGILVLVGIAVIFILQTTRSREEVEFSKLAEDLEGGRALPPTRRTSGFFTTALDEGDVSDRLPAQPGTRVFHTGTPATVRAEENY